MIQSPFVGVGFSAAVSFSVARTALAVGVWLGLWGSVASASAAPEAKASLSQCVADAESAQEQRAAGNAEAALTALRSCAQPVCPDVVRNDCARWLDEMVARPTFTVIAEDPDGTAVSEVFILIDGEEAPVQQVGTPIPLSVGTHQVRVEAENRTPAIRQVQVTEQQVTQTVQFVLRPLSGAAIRALNAEHTSVRPHSQDLGARQDVRIWPWIAGGVGVVGLGAFAYFGLQGSAQADELRQQCGARQACSQAQVDDVQSTLTVADVSLAVGITAIGAAVWGFLLPRRSEEGDSVGRAANLELGIGTSSVEALWHF